MSPVQCDCLVLHLQEPFRNQRGTLGIANTLKEASVLLKGCHQGGILGDPALDTGSEEAQDADCVVGAEFMTPLLALFQPGAEGIRMGPTQQQQQDPSCWPGGRAGRCGALHGCLALGSSLLSCWSLGRGDGGSVQGAHKRAHTLPCLSVGAERSLSS